MLKHIYIETSIPSLYYDIRTDAETVARTHWTQQWWNIERDNYELVTSSGVIQELSQGNHPNKTKKMALINHLPLLPLNQEIAEIIEVYINQFVMPADPTGDALHLAVASYYKIDILLTWNCQHIANAKKFDHIFRVNSKLG
jgi:predicted nucleic acid-binding protein